MDAVKCSLNRHLEDTISDTLRLNMQYLSLHGDKEEGHCLLLLRALTEIHHQACTIHLDVDKAVATQPYEASTH
ncbi:hypothetical protein F2P79_001421 [Pimephales promelas]|nr:hypothetical protein F2P79_001421 [Pimephales promelas]